MSADTQWRTQISEQADGASTIAVTRPDMPWDSHTVVTDVDGRVQSDSYDYSATVDAYGANHNLANVQITQMDAQAAE